MPKSFEENRDSHIKQAQAFLNAAQSRVGDNLPYRTAVSDAVEAIKHCLQAYLWQHVAAISGREPTVPLQEVALKGSMPEMLNAAASAHLQLSDVDRTIRDLNDLRNQFIHGLPQRGMLVTKETAERAVKVAARVDERVRRSLDGGARGATAALPLTPAPKAASASPVGAPASASASISSGSKSATVAPPPTTPAPATQPILVAPATSASSTAQDGEGDDSNGDGEPDVDLNRMPANPRPRGRTAWLVALAAVLALAVGLSGGVALGYPLGQGHAPSWLPVAWLPAGLLPSPTPIASATATPATLASGPFAIGALLVTPSACGVAPITLTLRDSGAATVNWSAGSPDSAGAAFALAPTTLAPSPLARPTLAGRLAPGASVTLTITGVAPGAGRVVIVADGGTLAVPLGSC